MFATIIKRLLQGFVVIVGVTILSFVLMRMIKGDPVNTMAPQASAEQKEVLRRELGLDKSIPEQFVRYIEKVMQGDFGYSYFQKQDVLKVIADTTPLTVLLVSCSLVVSLFFGILLGIVAALCSNTWIDRLISAIAVLFQSIPNYWVATMSIIIVSGILKWLPSTGYKDFRYVILPAIVLSLPLMAVMIRNVRVSMMDSLNQDFVKAAKARGIPFFRSLFGYAFRNSLVPLMTILGTQLGYLFGNTVVIEYVFSFPGMGYQIFFAMARRDYFLVQGLILVLSAFFVVVNILVDIGHIYLDPRIRKAQGGL